MKVNTQSSKLFLKAKPWLNVLARATLGNMPRSAFRLIGPLAKDGGVPVRDTRYRPWASDRDGNFLRWYGSAQALRRVLVSGVEGMPQPLARQFAEKWGTYCSCRYGLLMSHGTDALRIALAALLEHDGLDYGGEVIVPNYSYIGSATAPLDRRFGVAFVDVDPRTLLLDPARVEEAIITGKTRAIMPVHLFGQPADMTALRTIATKHGLKIVEDAAQAHGAVWQDGPVGSLGDAAGFSFQHSKNLNCGEGGILTTNDEEVFERAYSMHNAGRPRFGGGRWEHSALGWNIRPTEYQATLLLHRFKDFDRRQAIRRTNFDLLRNLMKEVGCLEPLAVHLGVRAHGTYMFAMRYKPHHCGGASVDRFIELVQAEGAPIYRAFAATMSDQPVMQSLMQKRPEYFRRLPTPIADQAAKETVYIPQNIFLGTPDDMEDIAAAVRKVERHCDRTLG
ncbi:MAG TPA: DegT/DnrJ/EryC1/StrS family aminotransferase [Pseudolabrys sp.]|nr:DegT/DnrJ/EryC1/StrS family aminotransferase [Pseudolabrys sp.]